MKAYWRESFAPFEFIKERGVLAIQQLLEQNTNLLLAEVHVYSNFSKIIYPNLEFSNVEDAREIALAIVEAKVAAREKAAEAARSPELALVPEPKEVE